MRVVTATSNRKEHVGLLVLAPIRPYSIGLDTCDLLFLFHPLTQKPEMPMLHGSWVQALLVLEAVQRKRQVSAGMRLTATALYSVLGAPNLALQQLAALDVKHIQHETLSGLP